MMQQLQQILLENDRSMSSSIPVSTKEQKQAWWRTRLHLDEQLAQLLRDVDTCYLGPWRSVALGCHTHSACLSLCKISLQSRISFEPAELQS